MSKTQAVWVVLGVLLLAAVVSLVHAIETQSDLHRNNANVILSRDYGPASTSTPAIAIKSAPSSGAAPLNTDSQASQLHLIAKGKYEGCPSYL
jgi:hypothetical protein